MIDIRAAGQNNAGQQPQRWLSDFPYLTEDSLKFELQQLTFKGDFHRNQNLGNDLDLSQRVSEPYASLSTHSAIVWARKSVLNRPMSVEKVDHFFDSFE